MRLLTDGFEVRGVMLDSSGEAANLKGFYKSSLYNHRYAHRYISTNVNSITISISIPSAFISFTCSTLITLFFNHFNLNPVNIMFTKANIISALALIGVASALPNGWKGGSPTRTPTPTPTPSYNEFEYDATFDDISDTVNGVTSALNFVNVYKSLYYQAFNLVGTDNLGISGVVPNSLPNVSPYLPRYFFRVRFEVLTHSQYAAFGDQSALVQGQPMITANYEGSTIKFFHLKSFYYGCNVITEESAAGVPASCDITITGYDINNNVVAGPQTFDYVATGLLQQMSPAIVNSDFQTHEVYRIEFDYQSNLLGSSLSGVTNAVVGGFVDTMVYDVYGTGGLPGNSK